MIDGTKPFGPAAAAGMRSAWCGDLRAADDGRSVRVCGWVARRREHGEHLAFVDLRDRTGVVQCVVDGGHDLRPELVVAIEGKVRLRPEGTVNAELATGEVELGDCSVEVLGEAEPPPFAVSDRVDADEAVRLRYRYVDLRRPRMQANLRLRAAVNRALRAAMDGLGFVEVETPLLWTPTPEGAREFAVPSRLQRGSFYVLPQSPQIAKQLLMVSGVDRYYQIARCMRDEDLRADRQFEFTQLDLEASFVGQEDVRAFVTEAVCAAVEAISGRRPEIGTLSWDEALDRYGTDKPDVRLGMELTDLGAVLAQTEARALQAEAVRAVRVEGAGSTGRARLDALQDRAKELGAAGLAWMRVVSGDEGDADIDSPLAKFLTEQERRGIITATEGQPGDLLLAVAGPRRLACRVLGQLRVEIAHDARIAGAAAGSPGAGGGGHRRRGPGGGTDDDLAFVWVVDFPLFEDADDEGTPISAHHPFTMPHPEDLPLLESDPLAVRSQAYDLVCNGWELGSGSIRIHRRDLQDRVFRVLGISETDATERFGFLLDAFRFGAPPHGGFAFGIDRLTALLAGEESIREVIAFPKTQSGSDPMTGAPKPLDPASMRELGLRAAGGGTGRATQPAT